MFSLQDIVCSASLSLLLALACSRLQLGQLSLGLFELVIQQVLLRRNDKSSHVSRTITIQLQLPASFLSTLQRSDHAAAMHSGG